MFFDLSGQTAIVTGAAQGIGAGIASRLARAGAEVAVTDLNIEKARESAAAITAEGFRAFAIAANVANVGAVKQPRNVHSRPDHEAGNVSN